MMKKNITLIFMILIFFSTYSYTFAASSPFSVKNNRFGIHITNEKDLPDAAVLVNSSGGDWGYVTFVITEADRNHDRWQSVFDQMRRLHLIPIVRIATKANEEIWEVANEAEINNWVAFLNSLNWVVQNRYVTLYNEPNHAKEWGGKIDPEGYANYLNNFANELHSASPDFFVLPAGLDASAKNTTSTMDESTFLKRMLVAVPNLFDSLDGWVSHSYPNPGFSGSETDTGRGTIGSFDWELNYLKSLGVTKELPVFITETGWSNKEVDPNKISDMYGYAFRKIWNDNRVVAVTPFILNYPQEPFAEFSWKKADNSFYPYYSSIQAVSKISGEPVQIVSGQIIGAVAQPVILFRGDFLGAILARNTGQSIWNTKNILVTADTRDVLIKSYSFPNTEPTRLGLIFFKASLSETEGFFNKSIFLSDKNGKRITNSFPIEGVIAKIDKMQVITFFGRIGSYLQSSLNLKF
ncbi:hypothetical protein A2208_00810 [Candidatus Woesebacteria bacterium RIFOXYA1_FULL_43_16]|nr:MAG: hypothetical protein A2208_00810 [Candidatus Woesebacteria bacterium RIFOXYA1_FULL_43_16]